MYKVYVDDELFCDSRIDELALINPVVTLEANKAGSFVFTIPPEHPKYSLIKKRISIISVYRDNETEPLFQGFCKEEDKDFFNQKKITCEGELSYLNDSVQRPARYSNHTVTNILKAFIANHNAQVDDYKKFTLGTVTVTDSNNSVYCYTNMNSTAQEIKNDLLDDFGGYIRVRYEGRGAAQIKYIDYLAECPRVNTQPIELGKNLTDYKANFDSTDIATAIIPLGAKLDESPIEGLEMRLTISSVNQGVDYVSSSQAIANYGRINKTVIWNDVTTPAALKSKGEKYLSDTQFENVTISAKAIDFASVSPSFMHFKLLDSIHVLSEKHGMDRYFPLTKQKLNLNEPDKDTVTLGNTSTASFVAKSNSINEDILRQIEQMTPESSIIKQAVDQASSIFNGSTGGYVILDVDEETGVAYRLLAMDKPTYEDSTHMLQITKDGIGLSHDGGKTWDNAWTIQSGLLAEYITAGLLRLGGVNNAYVKVYDTNGNEIGSWDGDGISVVKGSIQISGTGIDEDGNEYEMVASIVGGEVRVLNKTSGAYSLMQGHMVYCMHEDGKQQSYITPSQIRTTGAVISDNAKSNSANIGLLTVSQGVTGGLPNIVKSRMLATSDENGIVNTDISIKDYTIISAISHTYTRVLLPYWNLQTNTWSILCLNKDGTVAANTSTYIDYVTMDTNIIKEV